MEKRETYGAGKPLPIVEIRLTKYSICLTELELESLLARDPELWVLAIKRGKGILRVRQAKERQVERSRLPSPKYF